MHVKDKMSSFLQVLLLVLIIVGISLSSEFSDECEKLIGVPTVDELQAESGCFYNTTLDLLEDAEEEVDSSKIRDAAADSTNVFAQLLSTAEEDGKKAIGEKQSVHLNNERSITDFDDSDQLDRNYFIDVHSSIDKVDNRVPDLEDDKLETLLKYSKVSTQVYQALENVLDAVGEVDKKSTAPSTKWEHKSEGVAVFSEIISATDIGNHSKITLKTDKTDKDGNKIEKSVEVKISDDAEEVLSSMNVSKLQIQVTEVLANPFFEDTSADIQTPIVSIILKDESSDGRHLPIILEGVVSPFEFWMEFEERSPDPSDPPPASDSERHQPDKPLKELVYSDVKPFHLVLPYNSLINVEIVEPDPKATYIVVHLLGLLPTISDFCPDPNSTSYKNVKRLDSTTGFETAFETEEKILVNPSENPDLDSGPDTDEYLDYYVQVYMLTEDTYDESNIFNTSIHYNVKFTRLSCVYRDEDDNFWSEKGCITKEDKTIRINPSKRIHCSCAHASIFAGTQFAVPNDLPTLNVLDFTAADFEDNPIILATVFTLLLLYIIGMVYCFFMDRRDKRKEIGMTIMTDLNRDLHHSYYLVTVITGNRFGAGTTANVCLQLYGTQGRSQVYVLKESLSPTLEQGGIDTFLVSWEKDLGHIERIRLWHDNSGKSPKWYCRKIIIRNLKTENEWLFFLDKWLHVTGKESSIIYEKNLATPKEFNSFRRRFYKNFVDHLDNSHLWFSVVCHPTASRFTRCQRLSCAFAILSAYLLLNIVVHGIELEDPEDLYGIQSYIVALQLSVLEIPFGFCLINMFRRIRRHYTPTLIVWRNCPQQIPKKRRTSMFIPRRTFDSFQVQPIKMAPATGGGDHEVTSEHSSNFSIPSTNIEEFESWVADVHTEGDVREQYVHIVKDQNIAEKDRIAWGRMGLVHAVRTADPQSFVFSGEHNIPEWESMLDEEIKEHLLKSKMSMEDVRHKRRSSVPDAEVFAHSNFDDVEKEGDGIAFETCEMIPRKKEFCYLPWWFIYIAWIVCLLSIGLFLYFTLLYGLHYGYLRSLDWLLRITASFLLSVFVIQPCSIVLYALVFTLCCPPKNWSILDEERFQILFMKEDDLQHRIPLRLKVFEPERKHPPLTNAEIFELKIAARKRSKRNNALAKLVLYILLLVPLVILAYAGGHEHTFRLVQHIRNHLEVNTKVHAISSDEELYEYLQKVFIPAIYPDLLYNGKPKVWHKHDAVQIEDFVNVLIGVPRIRQLRLRPDTCHVPNVVLKTYPECFGYYTTADQETRTFFRSWRPILIPGTRKIPKSNDLWKFKDEEDDTYVKSRTIFGKKGTYDGNGYVAELGRNSRQTLGVISYLKRTSWIDKQTRAIFIEFTTFNPNMNMFLDIVMLVEKGPSHSFVTTFEITPVYLSPDDDIDAFYYYSVRVSMIFLLIVLVILILMLIRNIVSPPELHPYRQLWFWFDILVIVCILVAVGVSLKKHSLMLVIVEIIQRMKINEYTSLQHIALWDGIQNATFAVTLCICFLKIWTLLVSLDGSFLVTSLTVSLASHIIAAFIFAMFIVLLAFACSGYILFGSSMFEFSSFWRSFVTLIGQALELTLFNELYATNNIMGPLFAITFGFLVTFIFLNILIAILNQSMMDARMVAREKYRTWGIAESVFHRLFSKRRGGRGGHDEHLLLHLRDDWELQPDRLERMKIETVQFLKAALQTEDSLTMAKMRSYTNYLLQGTGYIMKPRKPPMYHQEVAKEGRIDQMRLHAAEFLRNKLGVNMTVDELRKYNDVNKTIVAMRIFRLEKQVRKLQHLVDRDCLCK